MRITEEIKESEESEEKAEKKKSWKTDFFLGIVAVIIGLPFFAVDYKSVGMIVTGVGSFCVISALCQRAVEKNRDLSGEGD